MTFDVAEFRRHFPSLESGIAYFDGPGGTQTPRSVAAAVADTLCGPLSNRGGAMVASERRADQTVTAFREAMADLLAADPRGIVYGRSATQLTYDFSRHLAKTWAAGDEIVLSALDHDANIRPWVQAAAAAGVTVRWWEFDVTSTELSVADLTAAARSAYPAGRGHRGLEPARHHPADRGDRRRGAPGRRAALRGRRALRGPRVGRPAPAGGGLLRLLALQVPGSALRRPRRRPRPAGVTAARQAVAVDQPGAGAVRVRHPAVRADGRGDRSRRLHCRSRTGRARPPGPTRRRVGPVRGVRDGRPRHDRGPAAGLGAGHGAHQRRPPYADAVLHHRRHSLLGGLPRARRARTCCCPPGRSTPTNPFVGSPWPTRTASASGSRPTTTTTMSTAYSTASARIITR